MGRTAQTRKGVAAILRGLDIGDCFYSHVDQVMLQSYITRVRKELPDYQVVMKRYLLVDPRNEQPTTEINQITRIG